MKKDDAKAEKYLMKTISHFPDDESILLHLGLIFLDKKRFDEAEILFKRARQINSRCFEAFYGLGVIYLFRKDYEKANEELSVTVKAFPDSSHLCGMFGTVLQCQGLLDESLNFLSKAYLINPEDGLLNNNLALLYDELGNHEKSLFHIKKAKTILPDIELINQNYDKITGVSSGELTPLIPTHLQRDFSLNSNCNLI